MESNTGTRPGGETADECRCLACGQGIGRLDRFCPFCGAPRASPCPRCGALTDGRARYCPRCGESLLGSRALLAPDRQVGRGAWWVGRGARLLIGATFCLLALFAGVAWLYFTSPDRRLEQPVARISGRSSTLAIASGPSPLVLAGTPSGLLLSEDQGRSWQRLLIEGGVRALATTSAASPSIYLAGTRLWRGGPSGFEPLATSLPARAVQALAVDPSDPQRLYAAIDGQGVFRSDDGGASWASLGPNAPTGITALVVTGGQPSLVFAATSAHGVFVSADGRSWANANGFVNGALPTSSVLALAFDPHSGDRYVDPTGRTVSGALYAGTDLGLFKSIDHGGSWSPLPFRHPVAALAVTESGAHLMLVVDPNGNVYRSRDGGITW